MCKVITKKIVIDKEENPGVKIYEDESFTHHKRYVVEYLSSGAWYKFTVPFHHLQNIGECLIFADNVLENQKE